MRVEIKGAPPFDGEYEIDAERLTNRDYHTIKQVSGLRANEILEALEAGDLDVLVALAVCALYRAGHKDTKMTAERLLDSESGGITVYADDEKEVEEEPGPFGTPSESSDGAASPNSSSGETSRLTGDIRPSPRSPTGRAHSGHSAA